MKVLVTGSKGVLGQNLITHLNSLGIETVPLDILEQGKHKCDIRNTEHVSYLAQDCDVVVHSAAAFPSYSSKDIWSIDVHGTKSVVNAARIAGVSRFIHISSTAVYGLPETVPTPETYPRNGVDPYSKAKGYAEKICEESADYFSHMTIIRPKTFLGNGRLGLFSMLFEWADEGRDFPVIGNGKQRIQMLDVEDLCVAITNVIQKKCPEGVHAYNLGATRFENIEKDFQAVLDEAGHGGRIRHICIAPAVPLLHIASKVGRSPVYPRLISKLCHDSYVDTALAEREIGFAPKYSNEESLIRTYRWWKTQPHNSSVTGNTSTLSWRQGVLRLCKPMFGPRIKKVH